MCKWERVPCLSVMLSKMEQLFMNVNVHHVPLVYVYNLQGNLRAQILYLFRRDSLPPLMGRWQQTPRELWWGGQSGTPSSPSGPAGVKSGPPGPGAWLVLSAITGAALLLPPRWLSTLMQEDSCLSITVESLQFQCVWGRSYAITERISHTLLI